MGGEGRNDGLENFSHEVAKDLLLELPISSSSVDYSKDEDKLFITFPEFIGKEQSLTPFVCDGEVCTIKSEDGRLAGLSVGDLKSGEFNKYNLLYFAVIGTEHLFCEMCKRIPNLAYKINNTVLSSELH